MITSSEPASLVPARTTPDAHPDTRLQEGQYESTVPTVADRIAQTVAALALEPRTESIFHDDSYGYRPKRGALDAVAKCRERCWKERLGSAGINRPGEGA